MSRIIKLRDQKEDNPRKLPDLKEMTGFSFPGTEPDMKTGESRRDITESRANRIIEDAVIRSKEILARAEESGAARGRAIAEEIIKNAEEKAAEIIRRAEEEREKRILDSETEILKLSVEIAEKIIKQKVEVDKETFLHYFKNAVERLKEAEHIVVKLNPAYLETLKNNMKKIKEAIGGSVHLEMVADTEMEPGGFKLESRNGSIDGRISSQIKIILEQITAEGSTSYGND